MSKTAQDKILEYAIEMAQTQVEEFFDPSCAVGLGVCSPIELIFVAALLTRVRIGFSEFESVTFDGKPGDKRFGHGTLFVEAQARLIDWPVDFAVRVSDPFSARIKTLAIECDGHDFHERTKQQAAKDRGRDRALQQAGFAIMRFTGSELWNDPMACAEQVIDYMCTAYYTFVHEALDHEGGR